MHRQLDHDEVCRQERIELRLEDRDGRQVEVAGDVDDGETLGRLGRKAQLRIRTGESVVEAPVAPSRR